MTSRNNRHSTPRWLGVVGLLIVGMAFGAVFHSLWVSDPRGVEEGDTEAESHDAHQYEEEGVIHLSLEAQKASGIDVTPAEVRPMGEFLQVTGVVAPDQTRVAHIRPLARGVVKDVHVRPGDRVKGGDKLLTYDNIELGVVVADYASALAEVESARSNVDVRQKVLARSEAMLKVGAVAQTTHDLRAAELRDAQARLQTLLASVGKYEIQLRRFGMSDDELSRVTAGQPQNVLPRISEDVLLAPFAGIVIGYEAAAGELIQPDDEVFSIADLSMVWVLANVYERDLGLIRLGQPVELTVASYPGRVFAGSINYISDVIDPQTRVAKVRCLVSNPQTRLKLEMFATVSIGTDTTATSIVVPRDAVQEVDGTRVVFVRRSEDKFERRLVVTGAQSNDWVSITDGIEQGELVVSQGGFALKSFLLQEQFAGGHGH